MLIRFIAEGVSRYWSEVTKRKDSETDSVSDEDICSRYIENDYNAYQFKEIKKSQEDSRRSRLL